MMFRITSAKIPDELIRRVQAGVPVRLITDKSQYRNTGLFLGFVQRRSDVHGRRGREVEGQRQRAGHAPEVDRAARPAAGGLRIVELDSVFVGHATRAQLLLVKKLWFVDWFVDQFNRKWNNLKVDGSAVSPPMFLDFVPGIP